MKISERLSKGTPTFSFEFFPPKTDKGVADLFETIKKLQPLEPDHVSITYGAGGSTRDRTLELTQRIKAEIGLEPLMHLTCVGSTREEIGEILDLQKERGCENILALRGDPPAGERFFKPTAGGFGYADELVKFIAEGPWGFDIGVAGYPEGHPECLNLTRDLEHLKRKVDNGGKYIVTQLFFDNADFFRFRDDCVKAGIDVPIIAGIMPILNLKQIKRFVSMCGSKIPQNLLVKMEAVEREPAEVAAIGIDHALNQCRDLIKQNTAGIHYYTLNKSKATREILTQLKSEI
jgi:methylenetetrahydrofolate reductase (NADPH)